ncbi:MAG: hypothetical protein NVS9B9_20200 [Ktedonobacteraceae bacterium]
MADNVQIGAGTGPVVVTETVGTNVQIPVEKLDVGFHASQDRVIERGVTGVVPTQIVRDYTTIILRPTLVPGYTYANQQVMGGPLVLPTFRAGTKWGTIEQITCTDTTNVGVQSVLLFFTAPLTGSYADKSTFSASSMTPADQLNFQGIINVNSYGVLVGYASATDNGNALTFPVTSVDQNLYLLLISTAYYGQTYPSGSTPPTQPVTIKLLVRQD